MKANIVYGLTRTLNLGDFESARVNVSLSMEMEGETVSKEDIEKAYGRIKSFVDKKVAEEEARWKL
jgi:hypothetical protein